MYIHMMFMIHDDCPVRKTVNRGGQPGVQRPGGQLQVEPWHCGWDPQAAVIGFFLWKTLDIFGGNMGKSMAKTHNFRRGWSQQNLHHGCGPRDMNCFRSEFGVLHLSGEFRTWKLAMPQRWHQIPYEFGRFCCTRLTSCSKAVAEVKSASPSGIPRAPVEATGPVMGGHHFWTHHHPY